MTKQTLSNLDIDKKVPPNMATILAVACAKASSFKTMSNLEKIKAAARMGYSAILNEHGGAEDLQFTYKVVNPLSNPEKQDRAHYSSGVLLDCGSSVSWYGKEEINRKKWTITDYVYAGQLFGEPVIPEGQRFRVRKTGEVLVLKYVPEKWESSSSLPLSVCGLDMYEFFEKSELEPVFD